PAQTHTRPDRAGSSPKRAASGHGPPLIPNARGRRTFSRECRVAQLATVTPKFARLENALRRDNTSNQFRRCDVETRIARATCGIGDAHVHAPGRFLISPLQFLI